MKHLFIYILLLFIFSNCGENNIDLLSEAEKRYPVLKRHQPDGIKEEILCGTLLVFEDREKKGKKIPLNIYLFPSYKTNPESKVFIDYNGGPASPNENLISYYEKGGYSHALRDIADILIIDQRGTGASEITCSEFDNVQFSSQLFNLEKIKTCLSEINGNVNLSQYNSGSSVEDIESVRSWLNIKTIDFHGMSYGTRIGLEYMRRYPEHVNSLILTGTVSPSFGYATFLDLEIEDQLKKLISRCKLDSTCNNAFPNFEVELYQVRDTLQKEHKIVRFPIAGRDSIDLLITEKIYQRLIGQLFLSGRKLEQVPLYVNESFKGNFIPLIKEDRRNVNRIMSVYMSTFCPEDIFNNPVNEEIFEGTFTKGEMGLMEVRACNVWPKLQTPEWLSKPLNGNAPVLMLTGLDDIQTPPRMAEKVKAQLANARHITFPEQGHGFTNYDCWDKLVYEFLKTGNFSQLDTTCIKELSRPEFMTELKE